MEFPQDTTGDVLRRMQADGFDFSAEHPIEFLAVFPTEEAADTVAKQYVAEHKAGDKLANIETQPAESGGMELILAKRMLATYENISSFEKTLAERASAAGGHDDGWGVMQE